MFDPNALSDAQVAEMLDGWAEDCADGTRVLRLEFPLEISIGAAGKKAEPQVFDSFVFNRPKAGILDIATKKGDQMMIAREMIASMLQCPLDGVRFAERHLRELDLQDFIRAQLVMARFFPKPPPVADSETGGT